MTRTTAAIFAVGLAAVAGCGGAEPAAADPTATASAAAPEPATIEHTDDALDRNPDVPDLPFADNPDPDQCGIPTRWGIDDPAWLSGIWEGELIEPDVLLYDSHQRLGITGRLPHGSEVRIELYQENPVLDFYFVSSPDGTVEGWVPDPFVSFAPPVG